MLRNHVALLNLARYKLERYCCVCRKSETELRSIMSQQKKDIEHLMKVQQLENEKQAVDVREMLSLIHI